MYDGGIRRARTICMLQQFKPFAGFECFGRWVKLHLLQHLNNVYFSLVSCISSYRNEASSRTDKHHCLQSVAFSASQHVAIIATAILVVSQCILQGIKDGRRRRYFIIAASDPIFRANGDILIQKLMSTPRYCTKAKAAFYRTSLQ